MKVNESLAVPLPLGEAGATASRLARRVRVAGFVKSCTLTLPSPEGEGF